MAVENDAVKESSHRLQLRNADLFPKPEQTVSIMAPHIFWIRLARSLALRTI
jgi:hypothetical protein